MLEVYFWKLEERERRKKYLALSRSLFRALFHSLYLPLALSRSSFLSLPRSLFPPVPSFILTLWAGRNPGHKPLGNRRPAPTGPVHAALLQGAARVAYRTGGIGREHP